MFAVFAVNEAATTLITVLAIFEYSVDGIVTLFAIQELPLQESTCPAIGFIAFTSANTLILANEIFAYTLSLE